MFRLSFNGTVLQCLQKDSQSLRPGNLSSMIPATIQEVTDALAEQRYMAGRSLAVAIHLALEMGRPLFLEGEAGVGKTEVAKVLSAILDEPLIRLQCYEGLDVGHAIYDWDYARQMMAIRLMEARGEGFRGRCQGHHDPRVPHRPTAPPGG